MSLRVLEPGLYTLIVDMGRPGYRSLGVPLGGAADRFALAIGNALVGNPPDAAALEISLDGPTLQATIALACVVYGAPFDSSSSRQPLTPGKTFTLQPGEELRIGGTRTGMRAYFCVRGGIQVPVLLGSRSALTPLTAGAELPCLPGTIQPRFVSDSSTRTAEQIQRIRVLDGPQSNWFGEDGIVSGEPNGPPRQFTVSPASNRMGLRLQGPPLAIPARELVSEPVCPGTVQVTRDGQCIILGVDGQTIGGYPKIAQVIRADLDRIGQLRPGDQVEFVRVSMAEAERAYRVHQAQQTEWVTRLRATLRD